MDEDGYPRERYMVRLLNGTYRSIASEGMGIVELTDKIKVNAGERTFLRVHSDGDDLDSMLRADEIVEVVDCAPPPPPEPPPEPA